MPGSAVLLSFTLATLASPCAAQPAAGNAGISRKVNPAVQAPGVADSMHACKPGFVRRMASAADMVCVTAEAQSRVSHENRASNRTREADGRCKAGFVPREAFVGDATCVTPAARDLAREENRLDAGRRAP